MRNAVFAFIALFCLAAGAAPVPHIGATVLFVPGEMDGGAVHFHRQYGLAKVLKNLGPSSLIEVNRSQLQGLPRAVYLPYLYTRKGMVADHEASDTVLMKITNARLLSKVKCFKDLCVGQTRQSINYYGDLYMIVHSVYPNGIFYFCVGSVSANMQCGLRSETYNTAGPLFTPPAKP